MRKFFLFLLVGLWAGAAVAQADYRLRAGDTLNVEVLEDNSLNRSLIVLPDGKVTFPFAGSVRAAGRTVSQIEQSLSSGIASQFVNRPNVFVSVVPKEDLLSDRAAAEPVTIDIYVLGEVNEPGRKAVEPGLTFLQALAISGGVSRFAATKRIQLRRTDASGRQRPVSIDYRALTNGATLSRDVVLKDGDVILVPERKLFE